MEEPDKIHLHYQMLEYLFRRCKLATSCFNHTWEQFLRENPEFQDHLAERELKNIFWTEIAPNIEDYELLSEEQAEYFNRDGFILDLSDENLSEALLSNEPLEGTDYKIQKSADNHNINRQRPRINDMSIQKIFDDPTNDGNDTQIMLNIIGLKELPESPMNRFNLQSLSVLFFTEVDDVSNELSSSYIQNQLKNCDVCKEPEHLGIFSEQIKCMESPPKVSVPKSPTILSQEVESMNIQKSLQDSDSNSILSIPNISSTPSRLMTRSQSQTTLSSQSKRSALQKSKSLTPSRITRSQKALVSKPALNLKMSQFIERHKKKNL